jgi:SM-20-related protein
VDKQVIYGKAQIFDDLVPEPLLRQLLVAVPRIRWQFGWHTNSNRQARYWHHEIGGGGKENEEDVSAAVAGHRLPIFAQYLDWLRSTLVPEDTKVLRFYLNAHTYGTEGWPHTDTERREEMTAILYLATTWKPEWCGETVVFDANGDIEAAVMPRVNRLLIFPSDRLHAPRPLSKAFPGLRVVLVAKLGAARGGGEFFTRPVAAS